MKISGDKALKNAFRTKGVNRYPDHEDVKRARNGRIFPSVKPGFTIDPGSKIFTVGSCFARNIEAALQPHFEIPTMNFSCPKEEFPGRPNGLLNEFNPACMAQRLTWASENFDTSTLEETMLGTDDVCKDLHLSGGRPVTKARARARRREIDKVYAELTTCDTLVLTLGLIECWYDLETNLYLNQNPGPQVIRANPTRYQFEVLEVNESFELLAKSISSVMTAGVKNVLVTVSPVPLQTTFSGRDAVVANSYSKSVLRTVADMLVGEFGDQLDYYPSYEIVTSGGLSSYYEDNVHVLPEVVTGIVDDLTTIYFPDIKNSNNAAAVG